MGIKGMQDRFFWSQNEKIKLTIQMPFIAKNAFTLDVHITALFAMHAYTLESFKFDIHYAHLEHVL